MIEIGKGFAEILLVEIGDPTARECVGVFRLQTDGFRIIRDGFVIIGLFVEDRPPCVIRIGLAGVDPNRFVAILECLVIFFHQGIGMSPPRVGPCLLRIEPDRLGIVLNRLVRFPLGLLGHSPTDECEGALRILGDRLTVILGRFFEVAFSVVDVRPVGVGIEVIRIKLEGRRKIRNGAVGFVLLLVGNAPANQCINVGRIDLENLAEKIDRLVVVLRMQGLRSVLDILRDIIRPKRASRNEDQCH